MTPYGIYAGPPVHCSAIVDWIPSVATLKKDEALYRVRVWGPAGGPHDFTRIYDIVAKTEGLAAQEGLRRFTAEAEGLHDVSRPRASNLDSPNRH